MQPFPKAEALTFDCYGTLVDWEAGILGTMSPVLTSHGVSCDDDVLLELWGRLESALQSARWRPYREILSDVMDGFGQALGFEPTDADRACLAAELPDWPVFPDTNEALGRLSERYRLAIVSNIDDDLFRGTARHLDVAFDEVVTAQQVRAYKPAPAHFHAVLDRLALPKERVLHVAQSLFHDIAPARMLGWNTLWVDRRGGGVGGGATPSADARPDRVVPSLEAARDLLTGEDIRG